MRWILRPDDDRCREESVAGGKGASLARLSALGAHVPSFRVISAEAYRAFAAAGPAEEFVAEVSEALQQINGAAAVAVRSSALGEDSAASSYAGLYHTTLDAVGLEAVLVAIRDCWASYESEAAARYRRERGDATDAGAMAVVLMEMVHGEWSGVCFTAHPVTLALSAGLINAIPGLGEALVSGASNPEEITVSVAGTVLERGGAMARALPEEIISAVWETSRALAARLQFPQDVEWTWRSGRLYVLQSRPITTVADIYYSRFLEPWQADPGANPDDPGRTWSRMLADETWVSPISPLFYNIHNSTPGRVAFIRSHGDTDPIPPDLFKYHRATAYVDVRLIQRMYEYQPRMARIRGVLNFLPEQMQAALASAPWRWRGRLRRMLSYELENRRMRSFFLNHRYVYRQWPDYVAKGDRWLDLDLDSLTLDELRQHQATVQREMAAVGPPCAIAVLSHATDLHLLMTGLLARWGRELGSNGENLYARISSGLDDSETLHENEALWEMAERIRRLPASVWRDLETCGWREFRTRLSQHEQSGLIADFETFWRQHRHLGSSYKDLIWPRWGDEVDLCFSVLKGYVLSRAQRPSDIHARSARSRDEAQREVLGAMRGPFAPLKRAVLRWLFRYNAIYMAIRDNHRYYVDRNWYEVRRIYRSFGKRLVDLGVLSDRDEVFFLGTAEVEAALRGELDRDEAARRIRTRRQVWQTTLRQQGPKFLRGWAPFAQTHHASAAPETQISGIAASPGSARGKARVVYDVSGLVDVRDGEILVTRQTDPSWTAVFGRIGGLILETGGVLSHGTSLCREYGLPCVTAVERATVRIPDGSEVELEGSVGSVRILTMPAQQHTRG